VETARHRLNFLRERIARLMGEIEGTDLEGEVVKLAKRLSSGKDLPPTPSDAEWDLMLAGERSQHLPAYFLRLRGEYAALEKASVAARDGGQLSSWLDGPAPKVVALASGIVAIGSVVAEHGYQVVHALGLAYVEDGPGGSEDDGLD
jgi:hypothetical protein